MKFKFRIWHLLLILWMIIVITRFELLINIYALILSWVSLFLSNSQTAFAQINFDLTDYSASGKLFIILPVLFLLLRKKLFFLNVEVSFASFFIILLIVSFVFAPIITNRNPDFYKNIGMTKLLPPLATVKVLHFKSNTQVEANNLFEEFLSIREKVIKKSFDENIEIIDIISHGDKLIFYRNGIAKKAVNEMIYEDGKLLITETTFLLGTDQFGRDVFTRLIYGARISLLVGFGSVIISLLIGLIFGFLAGYTGGAFDIIFSRITDMFLSFPMIFLVVLVLALFGNSLAAVIVVLGFSGWMSLFKVVKTEVLSVKEKNYFISSKLLGLSKTQLLINEVLPVIIVPVVVNIIFQFGNVIIAESALSYLGLGLGENYPSWGSMIQAGQEYLSSAWWMIFFPGIILILTLLAANSFGISINRKLNPRLQND